MSGLHNYHWAWNLLDACAAWGVRHVVLSPGSRSSPLALAALRHPHLQVEVCVDERAAGFFALGLARASGQVVALVATSGSAIANWHPAVAEADRGGVPLLLLSADRPPELQDCGASQTLSQLRIFADQVRDFRQLPPAEEESGWLAAFVSRGLARACYPLPGPVHWNIPLREPLLPAEIPDLPAQAVMPRWLLPAVQPASAGLAELQGIFARGPGIIICGPQRFSRTETEAITALARRLEAPLFADVLSGLRHSGFADVVLRHPDEVLSSMSAPAWILRLGGTPVGRGTNDWLAGCRQAAQMVVSPYVERGDPQASATHVVQAEAGLFCAALQGGAVQAGWLEGILQQDCRVQQQAAGICSERWFEGSALRALWQGLPAGTPLFLGNSLTIRAANAFAGLSTAPLRVFGNRGVSGIDGNISTACGIGHALGPGVAVIGDLALLHDLNSLVWMQQVPLVLVVLDNGGGGIFDHLSQAGLPEFERGWLTPRPLGLTHAAAAFGIGCEQVHSPQELLAAVVSALHAGQAKIIHAPVDRAVSLAGFQQLQRNFPS